MLFAGVNVILTAEPIVTEVDANVGVVALAIQIVWPMLMNMLPEKLKYVKAIPGLFSVTYTQNTGGAWSMLEGMIWLFVVIFVAFMAVMLWELITK